MKISGIKILRLVTNEEIIGDMTSQGDTVTVMNPFVLHLQPTDGGLQVQMFPYAPYSVEKSLMFSVDHVITAFTPDEQMINNYTAIINPPVQDVEIKSEDTVVDLDTSK